MKSILCHELTGQIWELHHLKHRSYCAKSYHHTARLKNGLSNLSGPQNTHF